MWIVFDTSTNQPLAVWKNGGRHVEWGTDENGGEFHSWEVHPFNSEQEATEAACRLAGLDPDGDLRVLKVKETRYYTIVS